MAILFDEMTTALYQISDLFLNWWPKCWSKHRHTCTCNTSIYI